MMAVFLFVVLLVTGGITGRLYGSGYDGNGLIWDTLDELNKWWIAIAAGVVQYLFVSRGTMPEIALPAAGIMFAAMKLARMPGRDVSELVGNPPKARNNMLDWIDPDRFKGQPIAHSVYRFEILGLYSGIILSLASVSFWPILAGLTMGPIYWFGLHWLGYKKKLVNDGLRVAEIIYYAILFAATFIGNL